MLQSPVSPTSPTSPANPTSPASPEKDQHGGGAFPRIQNYEDGLEVAENQDREKIDKHPVAVNINSPVDTVSPLYVTHGRWAEAPQPIDSTSPQAMGDAALESNRTNTTHVGSDVSRVDKESTVVPSEPEERRGWFGGAVSGKVLVLIGVLVVLLVGAIVGGAVGGTQANKNKSSPPSSSNADATQSGASSTSGTSTSDSSANDPHVRFRLQTYDDYNYKGAIQVFEEPGLFRSGFEIYSYTWVPARSGDYLDSNLLRCSVAFCANQTVNGWWGATAKQQPGDPGANKTARFIHIACDKLNLNPECRGLDDPAVASGATTKDVVSLVPSATVGDGGGGGTTFSTSTVASSRVSSSSSAGAKSRSGGSGGASSPTPTSAASGAASDSRTSGGASSIASAGAEPITSQT